MSKVVEQLGVGAALIGANFLLPGLGVALTGALSSILVSTGAGFVLSGIGTLLGQKATGVHTTSKNPLQPWQVIYGTKKVGGTIVYQEEVASHNRIMLLVIAVACHPCDAITEVWLNNKAINLRLNTEFADQANPNGFWQSFDPPQGNWQIETISRVNNVVSVTFAQNPNSAFDGWDGETIHIHGTRDAAGGNTFDGYFPMIQTGPASYTYTSGGVQGQGENNTGTMTSTWPQYGGTVTVGYYLGNQTQASGIIQGNTQGYWTSQCILTGRTYVAMKLIYDSDYYNGIPEISFVVRGKNDIYDPRTGSKSFTNNAALVIADYLAQPLWGFNSAYSDGNGNFVPPTDTRYGETIPTPQLIAAANVCDELVPLALGGSENRYQCDGAFDVSVKRGEVLSNLLTSCGGRLVSIGGQFFIQPAAWVTPIGAITVGGCATAPKMMASSIGLVPEAFNSPAGAFVPGCAGSTTSQFIFALGLINAYQATQNSNALALARLILQPIASVIFRGMQVPAIVTAKDIWSPNYLFGVKQAFLGDNGATISPGQDFAADFADPAGWRLLNGLEVQTAGDAYNWAIRLFGTAGQVLDSASSAGPPDLGWGQSPYGDSYGDPQVNTDTVNSQWIQFQSAILKMASIAYQVSYKQLNGNALTVVNPAYQGGAVPYAVEFTGTPPALTSWVGPFYTGYQSPWAVRQVDPTAAGAALVAAAVQFLHDAQVALQGQRTAADTVVFTVTGANPQVLSVPIQVSSLGTAYATFQYAGLNAGTDTIVATLPSHALTSNAAEIAWSAYNVPFACVNTQIAIYPATDGTGAFPATLGPLQSTLPCDGLMFNSHPYGLFPGDPHQSGNQANPFVCNQTGTAGEYEGDLAITSTNGRFLAVITGSFTVQAAGNVTFTAYVNSRHVIGVQGATFVSGEQDFGALTHTAINGYTLLAGNNSGAWPGGNWAVVTYTFHFAAPGIYAFEIDYASGLFSERQFCLLFNGLNVIPSIPLTTGSSAFATGTAPSGQLQLTPYSGGDAIGQNQFFSLSLTGISFSGPSLGPFAPVYYPATTSNVQQWGEPTNWGWNGPDPNTAAGYFQYRPLAELCDLIAICAGTESYYAQAVSVATSFLAWIQAEWTVAASGPPNTFPQHGAQTTKPDVQCAALILHAVLALDLAARPKGAGGASAMNATQYALLLQTYEMYQALYLTTGPMAGTFCLNPTGAQDWSPIWAGEIMRSLSMLVTWANLNAQPAVAAQAIVWMNGLINFALNQVVVVDADLGYTISDLRGQNPLTWRPKLSRTQLFNGVKGTYIAQSNQWQQSDFPSYAQDTIHGYTNGTAAHNNDANWDADGSRVWKDVQLPFTTSVSMAQRLAKIELLRCRQQGRGTVVGRMSLYACAPLDIVYFSFPGWWVNKVMEVSNVRLVQEKSEEAGQEVTLLGTELDLQEADPSVYEWDPSEELSVQGYSYIAGLQNQPPD